MERELLDVVDALGRPTGEVVLREEAHARGIPHRTAHVWLVRRRQGRHQVLLQKRSADKDSWPGCYDISSAGHIPAGVDYIPSALRELCEELGVRAAPEELVFCGHRWGRADGVFHGAPFHDQEYIRVFYLPWDRPDQFTLQASEVEAVRWMDLDDCLAAVRANTIPHCIFPEELELLRKALP